MKNILHFHPNQFFSKKFVTPLIEEERKAGFDSQMVNSVIYDENESIRIKFNLFSRDCLKIPIAIYQIVKLLNTTRPDIVITHNSLSSAIPLVLANFFRVKRIIYFNHGVPSLGYKFPFNFILECIERVNCVLADEVLSVSTDMKTALMKLTKKNITIINAGSCCGINNKEFSRKRYFNSGFRKRYKIKKTDFLVVFIGRPVSRKGYNTVISLWKEKFQNNQNFKLILCGSLESDMKKLIHDIPKNIIFMGLTSNIAEILASADTLVIPSRHEGLSYVILEAMASGCPVIATGIPGIKCLVEHEKNGLLVDVDDPSIIETIYENILLLQKNNSLKEDIISKGLKKAQKYSRTQFMKSYIQYISRNN
jgi:glycosyltransferase involved in cell wall biosynthesis